MIIVSVMQVITGTSDYFPRTESHAVLLSLHFLLTADAHGCHYDPDRNQMWVNRSSNHRLTVEQAVKMQTLEVLPLSHEAAEWSGPALSQHLNPLHVHLKAGEWKRHV